MATWLFWLMQALSAIVFWQGPNSPGWVAVTVGGALFAGGGASLCFVLDRLLRRYDSRPVAYTVPAALVACLFGVAVYTFYYEGVTWLMAPKVYALGPLTPYQYTLWMFAMKRRFIAWAGYALWMFAITPTFIAWAGVRYAVLYSERVAEQELLLTKSQLLTSDAQNQMLRYQLNPHFLFNTLSAVATLAAEDNAERAEMTVLNLCDFLRMSLKYAPGDKIPIRDEIALENAYLAIQRVRFEERLDVDIVVDPAVEECLVPNLILQPLVENAVKYGVGRTLRRVRVSLHVSADGGSVRFAVRDDGGGDAPGAPVPSTGAWARQCLEIVSTSYMAGGRDSPPATSSRGGLRSWSRSLRSELPGRRREPPRVDQQGNGGFVQTAIPIHRPSLRFVAMWWRSH